MTHVLPVTHVLSPLLFLPSWPSKQRPLPEITVSNTGQVPAEVMGAIRADHSGGGGGSSANGGGGSGGSSDNDDDGTRKSARDLAVGHLTLTLTLDLDLAKLEPPSLAEEGGGGGEEEEEEEEEADEADEEEEGGGRGRPGTAAAARVRGVKQTHLALQLWWPLLAGLAGGASDPRLDCRAAALSTLQDILKVRPYRAPPPCNCCCLRPCIVPFFAFSA